MVNLLSRIGRHVLATKRRLRRAFPDATLGRIEQAVHAGESLHDGEVRFAVEPELDWRSLLAGESARARALEIFSLLQVWDTERNNGVLIYVLFADRDVEIVADRGFNGLVAEDEWRAICEAMRDAFARGQYESGAVAGVAAVSALIARSHPASAGRGRNELPDRPVML
ncbi:MAG: hypothetical protein H6R27_489 [Proteobacteria bacterium]|nr:hypothetical protein [Pseudomonadota bacterium]